MENSKKITVQMTAPALVEFVFRSYYTRLGGLVSIFLGLLGTGLGIYCIIMGGSLKSIIIYFAVAVICLVANPVTLYIKALNQLRTSPSYKDPVVYEIGAEGLKISLGNESDGIGWENVYRLLYTKRMFAIYTNPYNAFVIPNEAMGNEKDIILGRVVSYTSEYYPKLSGNLKVFLGQK